MRTRLLPWLALLTLAASIQPADGGQLFSGKECAEGDVLYKSAFTAYDGGDYRRAEELLGQAEKLKPNQADGWNLRGAVYLKEEKFGQAEAAFKRAIALDPNLWAAQFNYAEAAFRGKNYPVARSRFDRLADQTSRYKQKSQLELARYKALLSSLLMNDDAGAQKRLAKLPAAGGATPAFVYAQAAVAFRRKDEPAARKALSLAQTSFSPSLNNLFSESLETFGWQSAPAPATMALAAAGTLPANVGIVGSQRPAYVVDPKLEAAAAEPLPAPESSAPMPASSRNLIPVADAARSDGLLSTPATVRVSSAPTPAPDSALERGTLLD